MMRLERDIVIITGMTGMGKSRWTRQQLRSIPRVFVMDTQVEHDGLLFDDLGDMIDHVMAYRTFRVRTEYADDFPMLCSIAFAAGNATLVVEEAQRVLPSSRRDIPASFADAVYRGRHKRLSLFIISQRPSTVHIAARSQWNRMIVFRQTEPADVDWITNVSGHQGVDPMHLPQSHYYDITPTSCEKKVLDDVRKPYETIEPDGEPQTQTPEGETS